MDHDNVLDLYPVLQELPDSLREQVLAESPPLAAPAGHTLFGPSSPCGAFPLLLRGAIRAVTFGGDGREILLYRLNPGESCLISACCLLGTSDYPCFGIVEATISARALSRPLFRRLVAESAPFREFIFKVFADRVTHLMGLVGQVAFQRLDQRLAALLLERGPLIESTHRMLADELGSVREVVSRILKHFEQQGYLRLGRGHIEIKDLAALRRIPSPR